MILRGLLILALVLLLASPSWAAVAWVNTGTASGGTNSLSLAQPASIVAGNLLIMCLANKYPVTSAPATPTGYTAPSNNQANGDDNLDTDSNPATGTGTNDQGATQVTLFYRVADGSESGNVAVTITSGNSAYGGIIQYTNATGAWLVAATQGNDGSTGTSYSATMNADQGIAGGDFVIACSAKTYGSTNTAVTELVTTTGITYAAMTERNENGTTFGDNVGFIITEHSATSGTSSAASIYSYTYSTNVVGGTVLLRIREDTAAVPAIQSSSGFMGAIIK